MKKERLVKNVASMMIGHDAFIHTEAERAHLEMELARLDIKTLERLQSSIKPKKKSRKPNRK